MPLQVIRTVDKCNGCNESDKMCFFHLLTSLCDLGKYFYSTSVLLNENLLEYPPGPTDFSFKQIPSPSLKCSDEASGGLGEGQSS